MKNRVLAGLTVAGAAILASCSQDLTQSAAVPTQASFAKVVAPTCSFSTASNDARAYFSSNKDSVFTLLSVMSTAYKAGGAAGATSAGFDVLARLAAAADAGSAAVKGTPAQGSTFANDVLLCMAVATYTYPLDLTAALGPTGLLGVRTGGTSTAVIARNLDAAGSRILGGYPLYGAEPWAADALTTATWPWTGPALFYGNKLGQSSIAGQQAAGILFDLKTLPVMTFSPPIRVGVCDVTNDNARTLHSHINVDPVILPPAGTPGFCQLQTASRGGFVQMLASLFQPKPLYAFKLSGGGAGLVGGLSELGPVNFTDSLAFQGRIPNAALSDTIKAFDSDTTTSQFKSIITVRAVSKGGQVALAGVKLTLSIYNNSGSYVPAPPEKSTAYTDASGYARFPNYYIDKAGGYQVTVTSEFGPSSAVTSALFNISGQ